MTLLLVFFSGAYRILRKRITAITGTASGVIPSEVKRSRGILYAKPNMMNKTYYVYILTNRNNKVMYVGMTNDIHRRLYEHQQGVLEGFTKKYDVHKLVCLESCGEVKDAIAREKQIKSWSRIKKNQLVETINPEWKEITL